MATAGQTAALLSAYIALTMLVISKLDYVWLVLASWLAAEAAFARALQKKARRLCSQKLHRDEAEHDGRALMRKCLARLRFSHDYLHTWFLGAAVHDLRLGNVREFLAYGFWYKSYKDLCPEDHQYIHAAMRQLQQQTGITLPEGYNPSIRFMTHLWDPLRISYKPLLFYVVTECIALLTYIMLNALGFQRHSFQGLVYYTLNLDKLRTGKGSDGSGSDEPLLFVHGVGTGLLPYLGLVIKLAATGRPLIMPEYQHIAMRLTSTIPTVQQCADSAAAFLTSLGITETHIMGHSYGTLVCARFVTCYNARVSSLVLFDPVCFSMYMPPLLHNFLYAARPDNGCWWLDQAMLMVSRELHCAATFCRHFLWSDYNLWPDSLPSRTLVALSGGDVLCAAADVKHHLESGSTARVVYHPTMHHGQLLLNTGYMDLLLQQWQDMLAAPASMCNMEAETAVSSIMQLEAVAGNVQAEAAVVAAADVVHSVSTVPEAARDSSAAIITGSNACMLRNWLQLKDSSSNGSINSSSSDCDAYMLFDQLQPGLDCNCNSSNADEVTVTVRTKKKSRSSSSRSSSDKCSKVINCSCRCCTMRCACGDHAGAKAVILHSWFKESNTAGALC